MGPRPSVGAGRITQPEDKGGPGQNSGLLFSLAADSPQHLGAPDRSPHLVLPEADTCRAAQQDGWFHAPRPPHSQGGVLDLSLPGWGKVCPCLSQPPRAHPVCQAQGPRGTVASLPWILAIFRPGLPSLSSCTEDGRAASSCLTALPSSSL